MKAITGRLLFVALGLSLVSSAYAGKCTWITDPPAADAGSYSVFSVLPLDGVTSPLCLRHQWCRCEDLEGSVL